MSRRSIRLPGLRIGQAKVVDNRLQAGERVGAQLLLDAGVIVQRLLQRGAVLLRHLVIFGDRLERFCSAAILLIGPAKFLVHAVDVAADGFRRVGPVALAAFRNPRRRLGIRRVRRQFLVGLLILLASVASGWPLLANADCA